MNRKLLGLFVAPTVALLLMAVSSDANADFAIRKTVNCDKGMDVQRVLDRNFFGLPMELRLVGTCSSFEITQNDVSIAPLYDDACPGATVDGGILLNGALRIELRCIAVTGGEEDSAGIEATESKALLEDVEIIGSAGLQSTGHSSIEMIGGIIAIAADDDSGVVVDSVSLAFFEGTHITGNGYTGVEVSENSSVHFWGGSISNNDENGVFVDTKSVVHMEGTEVLNNGRAGVALAGASFAELHGVMLADNGRRGIFLRSDSGVSLSSDTYVPTQGFSNTAIQCGDKESSALYDPEAGLIGEIDCNDVEF